MFCTEAGPPTLFNFVATVLLPKTQAAANNSSKTDVENEDLINLLAPRRKLVSRLPFRFGCNAKVFASFVHEKSGIRHIFHKHAADFLDDIDTTFKSEDEIIELICTELKTTFMSKKFLLEEDDPQGRGRRYIWKTDSKFGHSRHLVTIMVPESNNQYELITAFKRWA